MTHYSSLTSIGLSCLVVLSCSRVDRSAEVSERPSVAGQVQTCTGLAFPITGSPSGASAKKRCDLVESAVRAIAEGKARPDFSPGDTSRITSAMVTYFEFRDTSEKPAARYWSVDFALRDLPYDASVHIYPDSGKITTGRVHR